MIETALLEEIHLDEILIYSLKVRCHGGFNSFDKRLQAGWDGDFSVGIRANFLPIFNNHSGLRNLERNKAAFECNIIQSIVPSVNMVVGSSALN